MINDMLPGMPDRVGATPPKAEFEPEPLTLDGAIERSHELLDRALAEYPVVKVLALLSGGNDSTALAHLFRYRIDGIVHINTGTGVPETSQYVRDVAKAWDVPLIERTPPNSYEDLVLGKVTARTGPNVGKVVWEGFPGPATHWFMYQRLKQRALEQVRREIIGKNGRKQKVVFLAGMRWGESERRMRNAAEIESDGAIIWVSGIVHFTDHLLRQYRAQYQCQADHEHAEHMLCSPKALPFNEVTAHLHMSGECLCGAYAKPGELDMIAMFYPEVAARLRNLEQRAEAGGIKACRWGERPAGTGRQSNPAGRLCSSCVDEVPGQQDLFEHWLDQGLISADQFAAFTAEAS